MAPSIFLALGNDFLPLDGTKNGGAAPQTALKFPTKLVGAPWGQSSRWYISGRNMVTVGTRHTAKYFESRDLKMPHKNPCFVFYARKGSADAKAACRPSYRVWKIRVYLSSSATEFGWGAAGLVGLFL